MAVFSPFSRFTRTCVAVVVAGLLVPVSLHAQIREAPKNEISDEVSEALGKLQELTAPESNRYDEALALIDQLIAQANPESYDVAVLNQAKVQVLLEQLNHTGSIQPLKDSLRQDRAYGVMAIAKTSSSRAIGQRMTDLFDIANLDQQPTPRFQSKPVYPFEMRRAGITGEVHVAFIVDNKGKVVQAYAFRSSHREFEKPAIQAVSKWRFRPGKKDDRAVNTRMQAAIQFNITD